MSDDMSDDRILSAGPQLSGCSVCGCGLVTIRGRYPDAPPRKVCPVCLADRLDLIREYADPAFGQAVSETPRGEAP